MTSRAVSPAAAGSVAELAASARDELLQLRAHAVVERRLLVALERRAPQLGCACGRVAAAVSAPAVEVLRRGQERAVEALAEALERVDGAEEVPAGADLLMRAEGETRLVDLERREHVAQLAQELDVDDELLVAGDQAALEPARRVHHEVGAREEGRQQGHQRLISRLRVDRLAGVERAAAAPG